MVPAEPAAPGPDPRVLTVGRVNLDLYVRDLGVHLRDAKAFVASVGGSPTNIAIVAQRLGTPAAVLTATGDDVAGELVRRQLIETGVDVRWVHTVAGAPTSMALLAQPGPDEGERQFFRSGPADSLMTVAHAEGLPWGGLDVLLLSGDALAGGTTPGVVRHLLATARERGTEVWWDLDLRPSSWASSDDYSRAVRPLLAQADLVIGTEEEFAALLGLPRPTRSELVDAVRALGLPRVALKLGADGIVLVTGGAVSPTVPSRSRAPVCTVGGGDATAGALVSARLAGRSWEEALELAMRVAAYTVEQPYCSDGFPTLEQLTARELRPRGTRLVTGLVASATPDSAGWELLTALVLDLPAGHAYELSSATHESALAVVTGHVEVRGAGLDHVIVRTSPFAAVADIVYVPPGAPVTVTARTPSQITIGQAPAAGRFDPRVVTTDEMDSVVRGGGPARRQVVSTLAAPVPAERLIMYEGWVARGSWTGWPPHRHDGVDGSPRLEETYYFRFDRPSGFGFHRNFAPEDSWDETHLLRDQTLVVVPRGYHLCTSGPAANMWLLNFLAGPESDRDRAPYLDPDETWITDDWGAGALTLPAVLGHRHGL